MYKQCTSDGYSGGGGGKDIGFGYSGSEGDKDIGFGYSVVAAEGGDEVSSGGASCADGGDCDALGTSVKNVVSHVHALQDELYVKCSFPRLIAGQKFDVLCLGAMRMDLEHVESVGLGAAVLEIGAKLRGLEELLCVALKVQDFRWCLDELTVVVAAVVNVFGLQRKGG